MANDFSYDANCVALWRFEPDAFTADSKGNNTLVNSGVTSNTTDYKEGSGSSEYDNLFDYLYVTDANLDPGFPLRGTDAVPNKTFSICFWQKVSAFPTSGQLLRYIMVKSSGSGTRSFFLYFEKVSNWTLKFAISYDGTNMEVVDHGYTIQTGRWYHIGVTYNNSDKSWKIRVWDDTTVSLLGESSGTFTNNVVAKTGSIRIGHNGGQCVGGLKDEIVVFNDVLSSDEIDEIRQGIYRASSIKTINSLDISNIGSVNSLLRANMKTWNGLS